MLEERELWAEGQQEQSPKVECAWHVLEEAGRSALPSREKEAG